MSSYFFFVLDLPMSIYDLSVDHEISSNHENSGSTAEHQLHVGSNCCKQGKSLSDPSLHGDNINKYNAEDSTGNIQ